MDFLHLTFYCLLGIVLTEPSAKISAPIPDNQVFKTESAANNIIYKSKDGGLTWEDVSASLPVNEQPEDIFAGESSIYLRMGKEMYRSSTNLNELVWEKAQLPNSTITSIAFNYSGIMAFNYNGQIFKNSPTDAKWLPFASSFQSRFIHSVMETKDGSLFIGSDAGIYKSSDRGISWRQVQKEGTGINMVESEGVLLATGRKGIMRSTDKGEHWEWVIAEGGVGITIEVVSGGFAAIVYNGITHSRRIYHSVDKGKTWEAIDLGLQPSLSISSIKQVGNYLLCGHPDGIFRSADRGKSWHMVHESVEKKPVNQGAFWRPYPEPDQRKVFKLFISGNVLYAVARDSGC